MSVRPLIDPGQHGHERATDAAAMSSTRLIKHCQVRGCPFLSSTHIGHMTAMRFMCPTHSQAFRCLTIPQQRAMLQACGPLVSEGRGHANLVTPPWGFR